MTILSKDGSMAFLVFLTDRFIKAQRHHIFCLIIAAIICLQIPFGTTLGIFTLIVLLRPSVKKLFNPNS